MSLRVELLGGFAVAKDEVVLDELANQPVRAGLFAFLAVRREATRDEIVGLLWPERSPTRARHALSQALHRLRQVVGHDAILADGDRLRLAPGVAVDVHEFEERLETGDLVGALALYQGHLLERFYPGTSAPFEHWVDRERARLERAHRGARRERLAQCAEAGDVQAALDVAQEWVERDPLEDEAQHALIGLLAEVSSRAAALRQYEVYTRLLEAEELAPLPETEELARQIRNGDAAAPSPAPIPTPNPTPDAEGPDRPPRQRLAPRMARSVPLIAIVVVVGLIGALALGAAWIWSGADAPHGRVVLADFDVESSDSALAGAVTEALRIDLEQTLGPALLSQREVGAALERMQAEPGTRLDRQRARDLAVREGAEYVVLGQVDAVGDARILAGRVVRSSDGVVVGSLREVARSEPETIDAIERLSRGLVRLTGRSVEDGDGTPPLRQVTTSSLEALRLYSEAVRISDTGVEPGRALALLEEAVALDSTFAMAHRKIASLLSSSFTGRARRIQAFREAFRYRDRLPDIERYLVEGSYYEQVTGDHDAAVASYETALELEPRNATALNNLASLYVDERRNAEADSLLRVCTAGPVPIAHCHYNRIRLSYVREGEAAARTVIDEAGRLFPASLMIAFQRIWLEGAVGRYGRADSVLAELQHRAEGSPRARAVFLGAAADLDAVRGRLAEAGAHVGEAMRIAETHEIGDVYYRLGLARALYALSAADTARAVRVVDDVVQHPLVRAMDPLDYPYAELAEIYGKVGRPDRAAALLRRFEQEVPPSSQPLAEPLLSRVRGRIALAEDRLEDAEAALAAADRRSYDPLPVLPLQARIHERRGEVDAAIDDYRTYLDSRELARLSHDATLLGPVLERLGSLEAGRGHTAAAAAAYHRLERLWADADPALQPRARLARRRADRLETG